MPQDLLPGDHHYRAYVGDPRHYDLVSAVSFQILILLGFDKIGTHTKGSQDIIGTHTKK